MIKKSLALIVLLISLAGLGFGEEGVINWGGNVITAKGTGVENETLKNTPQGKVLAKRAAMVDAYRALAEAIEDIHIDAKTTVKDLAVESDKIDTQVAAVIKNAKITKEEYNGGIYTIELLVSINGDGSIASAVEKSLSKDLQQFEEVTIIKENGVDYEENLVTATGHGVPPLNIKNKTQGKLLAKRAAKADAYRNLLEVVNDVQVDSQTSVQNLMVKDDTINTQVSGMIKGAKILSERQESDGSYKIVLGVNIFGENGLADTIDVYEIEETTYEQMPEEAETGYTGLIIDASGLNLGWSMSPKILDTKGREIYGSIKTDPNYLKKYGAVDYVNSDLDTLSSARAGLNPLPVKAVKAAGKQYVTDAIISVEDADKIIEENKKSNFLNRMRVVFIL